jgi:hypothetical protein
LTGKRYKVCRDCGVNREARFGWYGGVMTEQEIKDRAPDGSTHYSTYGGFVIYHKFQDKGIYVWDCDHWRRFSCFVKNLKPL